MRKNVCSLQKEPYIKPEMEVYEVGLNGIVCISPDEYSQGGGGVYDNNSIWDNGGDY